MDKILSGWDMEHTFTYGTCEACADELNEFGFPRLTNCERVHEALGTTYGWSCPTPSKRSKR